MRTREMLERNTHKEKKNKRSHIFYQVFYFLRKSLFHHLFVVQHNLSHTNLTTWKIKSNANRMTKLKKNNLIKIKREFNKKKLHS